MASPTEPTDGFSLASIRVSPSLTEEVKHGQPSCGTR